MTVARILLLVLSLTITATAEAQICRWKDASGKVHYADSPPPGVQCEGTVKAPRPAAGAPAAAAPGPGAAAGGPKSYQEKEMEFRKRRQEKQEAEQKAQQEKENAQQAKANCENARNRVAGLQRGGRVARYDASGQINYLGDEDIARELADAQRAVKDACK
jgi:hypothetical protein